VDGGGDFRENRQMKKRAVIPRVTHIEARVCTSWQDSVSKKAKKNDTHFVVLAPGMNKRARGGRFKRKTREIGLRREKG